MYMAYVYKHIRKDNNIVFYIGIGKTINRAYSTKGRNNFWENIVKETDYIVEIIESGITWETAIEKEKFWISEIGRYDLGKGTLVNLTDGGEGISGHSDELKKVLREHRIGKKLPELQKLKISQSLKGKKKPKTHGKNVSKSLKGRKLSEEHKKNIGKSIKNKYIDTPNPKIGKKHSIETIEKLKLRAKNRKKFHCPYCNKSLDITSKKYHFENCKYKVL